MSKWNWLIFLLLLPMLGYEKQTLAHGAQINYRQTKAVEIQAIYDDGTPMKNAQVVIYAPDDPSTPWLKGMTDEQGVFTFVPDSQKSGNWDVKVRQAGHGKIITIPQTALTSSTTEANNLKELASSNNAVYSPLQKIVMAAIGIWGFVGTALFFSRKKAKQ
jgi:nickel transport protein